MPQGLLPFQYQADSRPLTSFAGLPLYLDLARALGLRELLNSRVNARPGGQGYSDSQVCQAILLSQLAGGSCIEDVERLHGDTGLDALLQNIELFDLTGKNRRAALGRLNSLGGQVIPTASSSLRYLEAFHDPVWEEARRKAALEGIKAFIPSPTTALKGLYEVNAQVAAFVQRHHPQTLATLDIDATLIETTKKEARFCYEKYPAYQPLQVYWEELELLLHSEFRDGNVPAGFEILRVFQESLKMAPPGVKKVQLRSDTAAYQWEFMKFCAKGTETGFGVIDFAIGADVTAEFKKAVAQVKESEWKPLPRLVNEKWVKTGQEWAEVVYVPEILSHSKSGPDFRFVAVRELLEEQTRVPGVEPSQGELPFPTIDLERGQEIRRYKLHAIVSNRWNLTGPELIFWHRGRCGKSEEVHKILKEDLAGGTLPSGKFGVNAAWWALAVLASNLTAALKLLVLGREFRSMRLKGLRYHLLGVAGRLIQTGRRMYVRVEEEVCRVLIAARGRILELAEASG